MKGTQIINVAVDGAENVWAMSDAGELYVFNDDGFLNKVVSGELFDEAAIYTVSRTHDRWRIIRRSRRCSKCRVEPLARRTV